MAKILVVTNNDNGKTAAVTGHVLRDGEPVIEVRSSFLYRGRFSDYENNFQIVDKDCVVKLTDASAVGVLQSKAYSSCDSVTNNPAPMRVKLSDYIVQIESQ